MTANDHDEHDSEAALRRHYAAVRGQAAAGHPSEDDWARFAARELDAAAQAAFADHIVDCAECAQIYRAVALMRSGAPGIEADVPAATDRRPSWWPGLAAAAAIVGLMAGSVWWLTRAVSDEAPQETRQSPIRAGAVERSDRDRRRSRHDHAWCRASRALGAADCRP